MEKKNQDRNDMDFVGQMFFSIVKYLCNYGLPLPNYINIAAIRQGCGFGAM
jgi:hypothetical protein